jgi:MYXO-CTERM domain-containing protein
MRVVLWAVLGVGCVAAPVAEDHTPPPVRMEGPLPAAGEHFAEHLALGDFNDDGAADLAVGSPWRANLSAVDVLTGLPGDLAEGHWSTAAQIGVGPAIFAGEALWGPGDVTGDGVDDLLVREGRIPIADPSRYGLWVYPGGTAGLGTPFELETPIPTEAVSWVTGPARRAGDNDGDGIADVAVAIPLAREVGVGKPVLWWPGGLGGPDVARGRALRATASPVNDAPWTVAGVGDVDQDGYDDLAAGFPTSRDVSPEIGAVWFMRGGPEGPEDGVWLFPSDGQPDDNFGQQVGAAGDVDGDGWPDLWITAPTMFGDTARVYIRYGSPEGVDEARETILHAPFPANRSGFTHAVTAAGDMDGDGYDDLAVSAYVAGDGGLVVLFAGGPDGPSDERTLIIEPDGLTPDARFGGSLDGGTDLDGDGFDDLVVGALADKLSVPDSGTVWVISMCPDRDMDGVCISVDCDDADAAVGAAVPAFEDADGDGWGTAPYLGCDKVGVAEVDGDCADADAAVFPGAEEISGDGVDQDCDGQELCWTDGDGDGAASPTPLLSDDLDCDDRGEVGGIDGVDCNDVDPDIAPGLPDAPGDGVDADCDGVDPAAEPEGCGCQHGQAGGGWALLLVGLVRVRVRPRV